ncbi:hypothetical protein NQ318_000136 [Aromia moschata]|uniref:Uncharacterized protein n=1 Tax=Aromia moschata TaxID=1265417 RepID=A0AAV8XHQ4_9CUCU|nr:hypothetical protein NQ318_000136 [Aromia moschata]
MLTKGHQNVDVMLIDLLTLRDPEENQNAAAPPQSDASGFSKDSASDCIVVSDGEDDDDGITNSQIFKFSAKIKEEQNSFVESIDPYSNIKQELEDLDYCDNFPNVVDLTSELHHCETTRELLSVLESPVPVVEEVKDKCASNSSNVSAVPKPNYVKPPIVEPHTYIKAKCNNPKTAKKTENTVKPNTKRKNTTRSPSPKKKHKTDNAAQLRSDKKSIDEKFRERNKGKKSPSRNNQIDKEHKKIIATERKKKLKEISTKDKNQSSDPNGKAKNSALKIKVSNSRGGFLLNDDLISTTTNGDDVSAPSTSKSSVKNSVVAKSAPKSKAKEVPAQNVLSKRHAQSYEIQDTTVSSNFSPESDGNTFQALNSSRPFEGILPNTSNQKLQPGARDTGSTSNGGRPPVHNGYNKNVANIDGEVSKIVHWPVKWLREQRNCDMSPPVNGDSEPLKMPTLYKNFQEYYDVVTPLILLELWQYVYQTLYNKDEESDDATPTTNAAIYFSVQLWPLTMVVTGCIGPNEDIYTS